ncbi:MAG: thiamine-monophosphate kinase [Candidatus Saganbacteria bacterium]|uniref:Thiamine-monophosphate kinase n=1 Tax=Candidatus Saganbacteria bacterium TaxID=2575572 RepID=A0A833P2Y9_UNCSA|nr:MAG: thiamine-monophosphate kinase [Candidatus Saganbacteria bacterium]
MELSALGEFGLIEFIKKRELKNKRSDLIVGIGDDAAVLRMSNDKPCLPAGRCQISNKILKSKIKNKYILITTDALIEGVHFRLKNKKKQFFNIGYKALAASISDISAMGGYPTHALATIAIPKKIGFKQILDIYKGIDSLARKYKIDLIGGDTVSSRHDLMVSMTLMGEVEKANLLTRSGAKVGDLICATGKFGGSAASNYADLPIIRQFEALKIAKSKIATSMIDSSDGLVRSILEICKRSNCGAKITNVPTAKGASFKQALYGGEEYELIFTVPKNKYNNLKATKIKFEMIGEIIEGKLKIQLTSQYGRIISIKSGGYEHFKQKTSS